jgi:hypothetical protein
MAIGGNHGPHPSPVVCVLAWAVPAQEPLTLTAQQDRQLMLDLLKIPASTMRRGPDG